jgi:membrane fusion protein (multidrug efflux system)
MKKKSMTPVILLAALCAAGGYYLLTSHGEAEHAAKTTYQVTHPWRQAVTTDDEYVAQIRSMQHIEFRSFEKGYLQKIFVNEGQRVQKGQPMFQIMPMLMEADYDKAKAEYNLANIEYKNTASLRKHNVVSPNELALAKARLDKAAAEMKLAKTHLDFTTIKAPFSGIIDQFRVRLGSLVEEGQLLTTLSDNSKMWVYFNVSEANYLDFMAKKKAGQPIPVSLVLANGQTFDQPGTIDTIEADFDNKTGNVAFRATFPNPEGLLRHGQTGTVQIAQTMDDALVIPQKATYEVLDKKYVYVVDEKQQLHARQITIAEEVPHLFAVAKGLKEGDMILLEGLGKVHEGQTIAASEQSAEQVEASLKLAVD